MAPIDRDRLTMAIVLALATGRMPPTTVSALAIAASFHTAPGCRDCAAVKTSGT
jgi:hypothetical protein